MGDAAAASAVAEESLQIAWLKSEQATLFELDVRGVQRQSTLPPDARTPLGSLWKLFVHAYVVDHQLPDPGYRCSGHDREEVYCCERGERIDRDQALTRSCGLYYTPIKLQIDATQWRDYWQAQSAPAWLLDVSQVQPATEVGVGELLQVLARLPAQQEIRRVLLDVVIGARDRDVLGELGAQLRIKTWSWHRRDAPDERIGGFAGWLVDGTPVWAMASGTSQSVLARYRHALATLIPSRWPPDAGACVEVNLFARYPLASIEHDGHGVEPGVLRGEYRVRFRNGNTLGIRSDGELILTRNADGPRLTARVSREEYVARVLDREAAATPPAAARALAIAIRSYLQQNATRDGECLRIDDSSARQRVAPRPASAAAREVAAWTADLVLAGTPVTYHLDRAAANQLSWRTAVAQADAGSRYDQILADAFPRASLSRWDRPATDCQRLDAAADWLRTRLPDWRPKLDAEPGYAETREFSVCRLASGRPHVDRAQRRIFIRALQSQQDRLDLTHEYLHLAFAAHPSSQDETYIEALARRLLLE